MYCPVMLYVQYVSNGPSTIDLPAFHRRTTHFSLRLCAFPCVVRLLFCYEALHRHQYEHLSMIMSALEDSPLSSRHLRLDHTPPITRPNHFSRVQLNPDLHLALQFRDSRALFAAAIQQMLLNA